MSDQITYNKLVRDSIPEIISEDGKEPITHIADSKEYEMSLLNKLREEVEEFIEEPSEEEIADILEVLDALAKQYGFSGNSIKEAKREKAQARGAFNEKIILEKVILKSR